MNRNYDKKITQKKYTKAELEKALIRVENGDSYSEVCVDTSLNKSIIAREMRKRGNVKSRKNIDESNKIIYDEFLNRFYEETNNE